MEKKNILVVVVEDKPGVMQRISGMFTRRNFNIDSISVGHSEKKGVSRITLSVTADEKKIEQVIKQLNKIIEVIKVIRMNDDALLRELLLVKIHAPNKDAKNEILQYTEIFRGRVVDVGKDAITIEITGDSEKVEAFIKLITPLGVKELALTGVTAMARG